MDAQTLTIWTAVAAIVILIQLFILVLAAGVGLGFGWWYLRKRRRALGLPFLYAQVYALRVQHATNQVSDIVASVPIMLHAAAEQLKPTTQVLARGRNGTS